MSSHAQINVGLVLGVASLIVACGNDSAGPALPSCSAPGTQLSLAVAAAHQSVGGRSPWCTWIGSSLPDA